MKTVILILTALLTLPLVIAGTPHSIYGFVSNADDGTSSEGSTVTVYIEGRDNEKLMDVVGVNGNSQVEEGWLIDTGNFPTEWSVGEKLIVEVEQGDYKANTELILDGEAGNQRAEDMILEKEVTETSIEEESSGNTPTESRSSGGSSTRTVTEQPSNRELAQPEPEITEVVDTQQEETAESQETENEIILQENKESKVLNYLIPIIIVIAIITIGLFSIKNRRNKK